MNSGQSGYNKNMSGQITTNGAVLQILAQHLQRAVDPRTTARAAQHVLDWLGCAALGVQQKSATGFSAATSHSDEGNHRTLAQASRGWWDALQVNAACGNMLEMDDLDRVSILHPGPVIIPAAIAVAEQVGASGQQLLGAITRGYEATIRIGRALGTKHYAFFHNTSTCGTFGAAAAAASLLQLDVEQTTWALANAGSRTGGLWQMRHESCETKSLHNVQAAQTGVQAALLAVQGVRGPATLLEGPQGMFAAMSLGTSARDVVTALDRDWLIHGVSFKPWPACRHAHPTIDAALALRVMGVRAAEIEAVEILTYKSAIDFCDKPSPITELEAKFSLQHCAAVVFAHGEPKFRHFAESDLQSADVARLRARVRVNELTALTDAFPQHYGACVAVTLKDGRTLSHLQTDAKGDPELPMSTQEIVEKALLLLAEAKYAEPDRLAAATLSLADAPNLKHWTSLWP
jgi:2-methylcitrate dehydratase PrpD